MPSKTETLPRSLQTAADHGGTVGAVGGWSACQMGAGEDAPGHQNLLFREKAIS